MNFLINASNLHIGGAVQVATSAISELAKMSSEAAQIHILASTEVDQNLSSIYAQLNGLASYRVHNSSGISTLWKDAPSLFNGYDAVLTVFGPLYTRRPPARSVVGFAQPWILYPDNEIASQMHWSARARHRLKYWLQSRFFAQADLLVVELEHVRQGLVRQGLVLPENIRVVHNTLSALYSDPAVWKTADIPSAQADLRLGFLGRNYAHKNTAIFPAVHATLKGLYGMDVRFYVTFTDDEWAACSEEFQACAVNVGPLSVAQCPAFYQALDGVVFPSLLECFSATPLEAMAMERPLFASNRPFIRDVCELHAHYFDPLDPRSIADCVAGYFRSVQPRRQALAAAREHALTFSSATERARQYLACLYEAAGASPPVKLIKHV